MPLHWSIDPEYELVSVTAEGDVIRSEVMELLDAMASRDAMAYRKLFDGTNGSTAMGPEDLRALGARMRVYHASGPMGPLALVLPPDKADIVLPVLGLLAAADRPMRIFTGRQKARRWLSSLGKDLPEFVWPRHQSVIGRGSSSGD
ncbi:MAG: hypothetical protein Q8N31_22220 [Reyranella sp.]|nr:hypothetical protein [Reyranella sp.]MDP3162735.1 hypothetical protein [Reyranella sp.]